MNIRSPCLTRFLLLKKYFRQEEERGYLCQRSFSFMIDGHSIRIVGAQ